MRTWLFLFEVREDHGASEARLVVEEPGPVWNELVAALLHGGELGPAHYSTLVGQSCVALATARGWLVERPWIELHDFAPFSVDADSNGAAT